MDSTAVRVVRHRNRLPRDVMDATSLEVCKARLDQVLGNLVEMWVFIAGQLD